MTENSVRVINAKVCRLKRYLYTCAIEVGVRGDQHDGRYCYESVDEARAALENWDAAGHPPGRWIKFKSANIELLNPQWTNSP